MIGLIQLVTHANIAVDNQEIASIQRGLVCLLGIEKSDSEATAQKIIDRILNYRIFPDEDGKMNLSLSSVKGSLLLVPQFTLVADTKSGTRPGFSIGMPPEQGEKLFLYTATYAQQIYPHIKTGKFGANMQVTLCNDGPVTFILKS